jgi:transcriptional regulator with XRE-family HTH domain
MILEAWMDLLDELNLPKDLRERLSDPHKFMGEEELDRLRSRLRQDEKEEVIIRLRKKLKDKLELEVERLHQKADLLRKSLENISISSKEEKMHEMVGANLASVRSSRNQSQSSFVRDDLAKRIARSTYVKLETGKSASIRMNTLEDIADALEADPRILLHDENAFRAFNAMLTRADDWKGRGFNESRRSIKEAVETALSSRAKDQLEKIFRKEGPIVTPAVMTHLLRLPPLDDTERDTPSARLGVVIGWKRGNLPDSERNLLVQVQTPIPDEDYTTDPQEYPPVADRIIGAVLTGYWGYYLGKARDDKDYIDWNLSMDQSEWLQSRTVPGKAAPGR